MGHLDRERFRILSTKKTLQKTTYQLEKETNILYQEPENMRTHKICIEVEEITSEIYTYQKLILPVKSSQGSSYVVVLYDYESNDILTWSMKNQTKEAIT